MAAPGHTIDEEQYTFDSYNAHPDQWGVYHYHTFGPGPIEALRYTGFVSSTTEPEIEVYGVMCDGTVVLGCTEADGSAPQSGLDAQGGHVHDIANPEGLVWFVHRYHTHVCATGRRFTPEIQYYDQCYVQHGAARKNYE